jgi:protein-S-isoprenylcysteine O-methyltransferase Ste14
MKATNWEFTNRALVFGLILGCTFPLSVVDPMMSAAALANWLAPKLGMDADLLARLVLGGAALLLAMAALLRTWASAFLQAAVVYAAEVRTESLVADGPYRRVRNPLYFANVLMAVGMGALMSRLGFVVCVVAMVVFCYRLIFREEAELLAGQGEAYERYRGAVPQLWPALTPRIPSAGRHAKWADGFKAESWYWGFALAVAAFATTLNVKVFLVIMAASVGLFWVMSMASQKKADSAVADPKSKA